MSAEDIVEKTIRDMTPPDAPVSHRLLVRASFDGRNHIVATLVMFDEQPATVDLRKWPFGWSIRYSELPGGNIMWTGSRWERDNRQLEPRQSPNIAAA